MYGLAGTCAAFLFLVPAVWNLHQAGHRPPGAGPSPSRPSSSAATSNRRDRPAPPRGHPRHPPDRLPPRLPQRHRLRGADDRDPPLLPGRLPRRRPPGPPAARPGGPDRRMVAFLRVLGIVVAGLIVSPILLTGAVPLLQGTEARVELEENGPGPRPVQLRHHAPAVPHRRPRRGDRPPSRRLFGIDGAILAVVIFIQILTTNRLPLAISLMTTVSLISMEKKWPRWVLVAVFAGVARRLHRAERLHRPDAAQPEALASSAVVSRSVDEAFMGTTSSTCATAPGC